MVLSLLSFSAATAAPKQANPSGRVAAARLVTPTGTLLRREKPEKPWQAVAEKETVYSGDLLLGLPGAALDSLDGAVRLSFHSDLSGTTPFPIVETVLTLNPSKDVDLDFRLERGRVDLANRKEKGAARVRAYVRFTPGVLTLEEPGTRAALVVYGRWPAGAPFSRHPKPGEGPVLDLLFLVLQGEVDLEVSGRELAMKAPPGPALLEWDSVTGGDRTPHRLEKLPPWAADDESTEQAREKKARLEEFRQLVVSKSLDAALDEFLNSDDAGKRRLAVLAMGALDDIPRLSQAMRTTKHRDVWENGVLVLRHWIGRGPEQDAKLYNMLITKRKLTPGQAAIVMQLLHSFSEEQLARPETYETLLDYLGNEQLPIRGLAYWHLSRLVPAGRKIPYNPLDPKEERDRAVQEWRKLIPSGQLPPAPETNNK
jgi:hypothetical protein